MSRVLPAALLLLALPAAGADDPIAPATVAAVKRATVFVRVTGDGWAGSGSGFVAAADGKTVLVVTNHHVAAPHEPGGKPPAVTAALDSGTPAERSYPAEVAAADPDTDLAVLRLTGVADAPRPIPTADPPEPFETMTVHPFGYPLGRDLAAGKGGPAVTVGRASVSSLRAGDDGRLALIQIDGNLNPGNSGGPVVDARGRLVGVAVARARDGQGIGFLVPAAEVGRLMAGRVGRVRVAARKGPDGKPAVRIEAELADPAGAVRGATAYCLVVPPKGKRPEVAALDKHPGSRKVGLTVEKGVAAGEFGVESADGEVLVQVVADRGPDRPPVATRVRAYPLAPRLSVADLAGPLPAGFAEYAPPGKAFVVWLPEKPARQAESTRTFTVDGQTARSAAVAGRTADGLAYQAEAFALPPGLRRAPDRVYPAVRAALADETRGRITESTEAAVGDLRGAEYRIETRTEVTRVRVYFAPPTVYLVRVTGTADQVTGGEAETILGSFRRPGGGTARGPTSPGGKTDPRPPAPAPVGDEPTILGGTADRRFKDLGPDGAVLVGLEVKVGKFGADDILRTVRPIYRAGGKEVFGRQYGTDRTGVVTLNARDGYAVGGITGKARLVCDGFSLTFMKLGPDGKLDPKDRYESDWVGWDGEARVTRVASDGAPAVGIVGKVAGRDATGVGLLFRGQEGFDPDPPKPVPQGKDPAILGGAFDPAFNDPAPEGGLLVGLELGVGKFFNDDVIRSVRPIYRAGEKESFGTQRGTAPGPVTTLKAKPGYAVGAVTCKHGLGFDGCSVTFMRVTGDGKLDPRDRYESDWVGWNGEKGKSRIGGDGTPVVGIVGKSNGRELTGFGLLFKGQEGFDPAAGRK